MISPLKDYTIKIGSGSTPTGGNESYKKSGITLIRSMNVYDFNFDYKGLAFIDDDQAFKLRSVTVEQNDLLLNITGASVARCCIVPENILPARVNQHVSIIRVNPEKANAEYLLYYLNSPSYKNYLLGLSAAGATREALTKEVIENLNIPFPPLVIQQKIASILSAYDQLIENNRQRIKLLDEMAEQIYNEWFVQLRFPGYEHCKFINGLPEGWVKCKAESYFNIQIGKTPPREESMWFTKDSSGVKWVSIRDINNSSVFVSETSEGITMDGIDKFNMNIAKTDTVILSFKLTVGKVAIVFDDMSTNEAIAHFNILDTDKMNREYTYCYLKYFKYSKLGNTSSIGTAVNSKIVKKMPFISPTKEILDLFGSTIYPLLEVIKLLSQKNKILQETRNLLLPRLISGKLGVENLIEPEHLSMFAQETIAYETSK
jgi:type I restriction enzyme S subunit